ncbi:LysR family transcriptional regulator, partial [bacterium]|nr:LysR family transcriptional regulator [bacterium]
SLKRLEEHLQVELFLRRRQGLILTASGQRLLRESQKLLASWEALVSETKKSQTEIAGRFRLGCHPSVAIFALKDVLRKIYDKYPAIELQLVHGLSRMICEEVISGSIDFGIVVNPIRHDDLVIHSLAKDEVCFWKAKNSLSDVLIYNPDLMQVQALLSKIKKQKQFRRNIFSENLEVTATLTGAGAGVAILPTRVVKSIAPHLIKMTELPSFTDEITFIHRFDLVKTAATKTLIKHMSSIHI